MVRAHRLGIMVAKRKSVIGDTDSVSQYNSLEARGPFQLEYIASMAYLRFALMQL
jgi:hypothetical protein